MNEVVCELERWFATKGERSKSGFLLGRRENPLSLLAALVSAAGREPALDVWCIWTQCVWSYSKGDCAWDCSDFLQN